jgi:hypothetical protein
MKTTGNPEVPVYFIKGVLVPSDQEDALQAALAGVYGSPERPRCMCKEGGVPMYVARVAQYIIKRMPDTGHEHHPLCPSHELEAGKSGRSELVGKGITLRDGHIFLRTAFPLDRSVGRTVVRGEGSGDSPAVRASEKHLSLRGLLHLLWDESRFNYWRPAMRGKRPWRVVRKYLMAAAEGMRVKGFSLTDRLLIPEQFEKDDADNQIQRRKERLRTLASGDGKQQPGMLIIGELKEHAETPAGGVKVVIKHMPELPLLMDTKTWERLSKVFEGHLDAKAQDETLRLVMAALVYARQGGTIHVESATLMLTTNDWIPVEGPHDVELVSALEKEDRVFEKPLRYESASAAPFPNAVLLDAGQNTIDLDVISEINEKERAAKERAAAARQDPHWVWRTGEPMPPLPAKTPLSNTLRR